MTENWLASLREIWSLYVYTGRWVDIPREVRRELCARE